MDVEREHQLEGCRIWEFRAGMWDLGKFQELNFILIFLMSLMFIAFLN